MILIALSSIFIDGRATCWFPGKLVADSERTLVKIPSWIIGLSHFIGEVAVRDDLSYVLDILLSE